MRPKNTLTIMETKAKRIKKIQFICNTVLANCCYHTKNMETQLMVAEKSGNITDEERDLITSAWDYRNYLAKELLLDLKNFMEKSDYVQNEEKKKHERKRKTV